MRVPFRWLCRCVVVCAALAVAHGAMAQELELKPSGLPEAEAPEDVLPRGAVVHARLKSVELLLNDVSSMATKFIPDKALPPQKRRLLEEPNPLLALAGPMIDGEPMSVAALGKLSGIDMSRPVTFSLYINSTPDKAFILALPVSDLTALAQRLTRVARGTEEVELQGGSALHVRHRNGKDLFVVCSKRMACFTGSRELAQMLLTAPPAARLAKSQLVSKALAENAEANLIVVADPEPVKPMLPMVREIATIREPAVQFIRGQIMSEFGPREMANVNHAIRRYLGVRDLEQLLDYVECALLGSFEALSEFAFGQAEDFQGIVLALDIGESLHRLNVSVLSRAIAPSGKPLPLAEAAKSVTKLPGSHNFLDMQGQAAAPAKSKLLGTILDRVTARMKAKQLPDALAMTLKRAYSEYQPEPTLESQVPWMVTTTAYNMDGKSLSDFASMDEYLAHVYQRTFSSSGPATVQAIPKQPAGFLEAHFKKCAEVSNNNDAIYRRLRGATPLGDPSYARDSRFLVRQLPDGVKNMVRETSYSTQWGLFGFNEHELINREFTLCRDVGDLTLLCPGGADPGVLVNYEPQKVPVAIRRLLTELRVPPDVNRVQVLRLAPAVMDLVDIVAALELKVHNDLAAYLKQIEAASKQGGTEQEMLTRFQAIDMPFGVLQLKQDSDGGYYVMTPIQLTYPRPRVMPEALGLFDEFRKAVDSQGGLASYERQAAGRIDVSILFSTEATATLVRTVGNRVVEKYLSNPEEMERVQGLFRTPLDAAAHRDSVVLTNPTWMWIPMGMEAPRPKPRGRVRIEHGGDGIGRKR